MQAQLLGTVNSLLMPLIKIYFKKRTMRVKTVKLYCDHIKDWDSFHIEFARVFGFPNFYGCNMNAWYDCLSSLGEPDDGMTSIHCEEGKTMTLQLKKRKNLQ